MGNEGPCTGAAGPTRVEEIDWRDVGVREAEIC